ncbi:MAG: toprim domain-containing protein [bacterium]
MGTALTPKHIALLKRYTDEIIVLFDGDDAGKRRRSALSASLADHKNHPKSFAASAGGDPDTFLKKFGAQAFIEKSKVRNLLSVIIDKTLAKNAKDISGKAASPKFKAVLDENRPSPRKKPPYPPNRARFGRPGKLDF